ncbi:MAG TPA: TlpA disulfide reductase family protein [Solirubrobacterales bacterium]|nr:TlpA disulfide reductase family protein [Solirubrobacterales bacterium]
MGARTFVVFMLVLAVLGLLGYGLLSKGSDALAVGEAAPDKELAVLEGGTQAPDARLDSAAAGTGSLADLRGDWVLLNFWASWCGPCRDEAPALQELHRRLGARGFTVLGINLDDNTEDAGAFVRQYGLTYPQLRDGDGRERRDAYGMTGFPESFLIDPEGRIALIRRGPVDEEFLAENVVPVVTGEVTPQ